MEFGMALFAFVASALIATWLKQAGGPFRLLFGFLVFVPIGILFVATYAVDAPLFAGALVLGGIIGLLT